MENQTMNKKIQMWSVSNPFTGETKILTDVQKNMYVEIKKLEFVINSDSDWTADNKERCKLIRKFDKLREEFADKWGSIYRALLD